MRLTVIGCSAAGLSAAGPASGYLVETDRATVLFDCGPGVVSAIRGSAAWERIDAIFITHMHIDHYLDLISYATARIRDDMAAAAGGEAARSQPLRVHLPPGGRKVADTLTEAFSTMSPGRFGRPFQEGFETVEYDPAGAVTVGDATVSFTGPLRHTAPNWGMRVAANGRTLAYTGDTADCPEIYDLARDVDLFLCEASFVRQRETAPISHLTAAEAGRQADRAAVKRLVLTHIYRAEESWRQEVAAQAALAYRGPLEVARTGQVYEV